MKALIMNNDYNERKGNDAHNFVIKEKMLNK